MSKTKEKAIDQLNSATLICQDENGIFELRDIGENQIHFFGDLSDNNTVSRKFSSLKFEQTLGAKELKEVGGQYLTDEEFNKLILPKK
jgi:hypothetical protein